MHRLVSSHLEGKQGLSRLCCRIDKQGELMLDTKVPANPPDAMAYYIKVSSDWSSATL